MQRGPWDASMHDAIYVQVAALEAKLAMEAKMRADAEQTLDQERRSFQMVTISSGSGQA